MRWIDAKQTWSARQENLGSPITTRACGLEQATNWGPTPHKRQKDKKDANKKSRGHGYDSLYPDPNDRVHDLYEGHGIDLDLLTRGRGVI